jgi:hypothetical protein
MTVRAASSSRLIVPRPAGVGPPRAERRELRVQGRFQPDHVHVSGCGRPLQFGRGRDRQGLGQSGRHHDAQLQPSQAGRLPGPAHFLID